MTFFNFLIHVLRGCGKDSSYKMLKSLSVSVTHRPMSCFAPKKEPT